MQNNDHKVCINRTAMTDGSTELWREIALKVKGELQDIKDHLMSDLINVDFTPEELKAELEQREQTYFMNPANKVQINRVELPSDPDWQGYPATSSLQPRRHNVTASERNDARIGHFRPN